MQPTWMMLRVTLMWGALLGAYTAGHAPPSSSSSTIPSETLFWAAAVIVTALLVKFTVKLSAHQGDLLGAVAMQEGASTHTCFLYSCGTTTRLWSTTTLL